MMGRFGRPEVVHTIHKPSPRRQELQCLSKWWKEAGITTVS